MLRIPDKINKISKTFCTLNKNTQYQLQTLMYHLSKHVSIEVNVKLHGYPVDIYIPESNTAIMYCLSYKNYIPCEHLRKEHIRVIAVLHGSSSHASGDNVVVFGKENTSLSEKRFIWCAENIFRHLDLPVPDFCDPELKSVVDEMYLKYVRRSAPDNLFFTYPKIAFEWNYKHNGSKRPEKCSYMSDDKIWWRCNRCGRNYEATVYDRTVKNTKCPYCAGIIRPMTNALTITHPDLAKEWDYDKNKYKPDTYVKQSTEKVWWKCHLCGESFQASAKSRTGAGCPACQCDLRYFAANRAEIRSIVDAKKRLSSDMDDVEDAKNKPEQVEQSVTESVFDPSSVLDAVENNLVQTHPGLAKEWNYDKNEKAPECYTRKSQDVVWWKCRKCGKEWQEAIDARKHVDCITCYRQYKIRPKRKK